MNIRNFRKMLEAQWAKGNFLCVGLDPDTEKMPDHLKKDVRLRDRMTRIFCRQIVEATKDLVCAYKPNSAFFEGIGVNGEEVLSYVINTIRELAPDVPIILDAKRGDIGSTNVGYVKSVFTWLKADAITVNPYLGAEALEPFLEQTDKGIIVLCRTSNPGAGEFQDIGITFDLEEGRFIREKTGSYIMSSKGYHGKLYEHVAYQVSQRWNTNSNCGLVVGATYPFQLKNIRKIVGDMPILIPGIGFQQEGISIKEQIKQVVTAGKDSQGQGMIISLSRSIIFASKGTDFADAARHKALKIRDLINEYR